MDDRKRKVKSKAKPDATPATSMPVESTEPDSLRKAPHSFIFHRGVVGRDVKSLVLDMRSVFEPYTATSLRARKKNRLKDFVAIAGPLGVTHMMMFTKTTRSVNFKVVRLPRGPTITFRLLDFCLRKDVASATKKQPSLVHLNAYHPLLVLNTPSNNNERHFKLISSMFQNILPSINLNTVSLRKVKRCLLLDVQADGTVFLRHYAIRLAPTDVSRSVKKIIKNKVPKLDQYNDVADFLLNPGALSESEYEGDPTEVAVEEDVKTRGVAQSDRCAVRLIELGPRLHLKLLKIQEGVSDGAVLYHSVVQKSEAEADETERMRIEKVKLKEERRKQQEDNVAKKLAKQEEHKQRCLQGMKVEDEPKKEEPDSSESE